MKKYIYITIALLLAAGFLIKDNPKPLHDYDDSLFITRVEQTPIQFALSFYGVKEAFGDGKSNPIIVSFFKDFADWIIDDSTPWCSSFINSIMASTGYEYSGKMSARSWLDVGEVVKDPRVGDVVVFWRGSKNSWQGHVAMFISYSADKKYINVLGGNQGDAVSISAYETSRLLGFRRPKYIRVPGSDERFSVPVKLELESAPKE